MTAGTAYTFYVYRGNSCAFVDDRIAAQAHTFRLTSGNVGPSSATLKMENYNGAWYHQQAGGRATPRPRPIPAAARPRSTAPQPISRAWPTAPGRPTRPKAAPTRSEIATATFTTATAGTTPHWRSRTRSPTCSPTRRTYEEFGSGCQRSDRHRHDLARRPATAGTPALPPTSGPGAGSGAIRDHLHLYGHRRRCHRGSVSLRSRRTCSRRSGLTRLTTSRMSHTRPSGPCRCPRPRRQRPVNLRPDAGPARGAHVRRGHPGAQRHADGAATGPRPMNTRPPTPT